MEEKVTAVVCTAEELVKQVMFSESEVIIIDGMIEMQDTSLSLARGQILRGKDNDSGLIFDLKDCSHSPLVLNDRTALENLRVKVNVSVSSELNCLGIIVVDGQLVRIKNLSVSIVSEHIGCYLSAIYLRHRVEASGHLIIDLKGQNLVAVGGNNTAPAILRMLPESCLSICIYTSAWPAISKCVVELENAELEYSNYSPSIPREDFFNGYVFFIGKCIKRGNRAVRMRVSKELGYERRYRVEIINPQKDFEDIGNRPFWKILLGIR